MIERNIAEKALQLHRQFPVFMLTGPRQSGKTTLIRWLFPDLPYYSLEDPDTRMRAAADLRGFLQNFTHGTATTRVARTIAISGATITAAKLTACSNTPTGWYRWKSNRA